MIEIRKRAVLSGLDLDVEEQTLCLFRTSAEGFHTSRRARVCAGHDLFAALYISLLRGSASGRSQCASVLLPGSILSCPSLDGL